MSAPRGPLRERISAHGVMIVPIPGPAGAHGRRLQGWYQPMSLPALFLALGGPIREPFRSARSTSRVFLQVPAEVIGSSRRCRAHVWRVW